MSQVGGERTFQLPPEFSQFCQSAVSASVLRGLRSGFSAVWFCQGASPTALPEFYGGGFPDWQGLCRVSHLISVLVFVVFWVFLVFPVEERCCNCPDFSWS